MLSVRSPCGWTMTKTSIDDGLFFRGPEDCSLRTPRTLGGTNGSF